MTDVPARPSRRRRWLWRAALGLVVLIALIALFGPKLAAPVLRALVVGRLNSALNVSASIGELTFDWGGSLHAGGFALEAEDGTPLATLAALDVEIAVLKLVRREVEVDLRLSGLELDLRRAPDGNWNFERVVREPAEPESAPEPEAPSDESGSLPGVRAHVEMSDSRVRVHAHGALTTIEDLAFTLELASLEERAPFALTARVVGPGGPAGALDVHGEVALAHDGRIGADTVEALVEATLESLELAELAPLAAGGGRTSVTSGTLQAKANARVGRGPTLEAGLVVTLDELELRDAKGAAIELGGMQEARFQISAALDGAAGSVELERFAFESTFLDLEGSGEAFDLGDPEHSRGTFATRARFDPTAASAVLAPWLGGYALTGAEIVQTQTLALEGGRVALESELAIEQLAVRGPALGARTLELEAVLLEAAAKVDTESGSARVTQLALALPGIDVKASGELAGLAGGAAEFGASLRIEPSVELAAMRAWAAPFLGRVQLDGGRIAGGVDLRLEKGRVMGTGAFTGEGIAVAMPVGSAATPVRIAEDELASTFALDLELGSRAIALERFTLESETISVELAARVLGAQPGDPAARTRFESVQGRGTYVPERLSSWLRPWLLGELRGAERRPLEFAFSGEIDEGDVLATLRALRGEAKVELGELALPGLATSGTLAFSARGDELGLAGTMAANGGRLGVDARLDLRDPAQLAAGASAPASVLRFTFAGVEARPELAPLLAYVHPVFGALEAAGAGSLAGTLTGEVVLRYGATLSNEMLASGLAGLAPQAVDGDGRIEFDEVSLKGSPLLSSMVALIDPKRGGELAIAPVRLVIRAGRVGYDKPWQWTIAGSPTKFSGTLGLDGTLAMSWQVPVTPALVQRHGFLRYFEGETIDVPLQGSVKRPSLGLQAVLDGLARTALERELKERIGGVLPDLGGILGGGDPDQLLRRADDLHAKGEVAEAAKLYRELREKHAASLTYLLNKARIDERGGR